MWLSRPNIPPEQHSHSKKGMLSYSELRVCNTSLTGQHRDLHPAPVSLFLMFVKIVRMFGCEQLVYPFLGLHLHVI
jgi:hypothetical protein